MNLCLLCDIVVGAPKPYALQSLFPKSRSSSQPPPQRSSKSLLSYAPNSPLLVPTPAPIQESNDIDVSTPTQAPDDSSNKLVVQIMEILLFILMFVFTFAIFASMFNIRGFEDPYVVPF